MPRIVEVDPVAAKAAHDLAVRAEAIWGDPLVQQIFEQVRNDFRRDYEDGKTVVEREKAHSCIMGLKKVQERFERYVAHGETLKAIQDAANRKAAVG